MKQRAFWIYAALMILLGACLFLWIRARAGRGHSNMETRVIRAAQGNVSETVDATGVVVPMNRVEVKPPVSGRLEKILVQEGNRIRAGQVLAWMSSTERAAILDSAMALGEAERQRWEESYKPAPIISPISGMVILNNVVPGQTVDGGTVLFALSDQLIVLANVDEADISRVQAGMKAWVTLDAYPAQKIPGKVIAILYEGKNISNVITYGVKIVLSQVPAFFRSQMTANVSLVVSQKENVVLIPLQAVQARPNGDKYVLVPNPGGKPRPMNIQTGIENGAEAEVLAGLKAGDEILIQHMRYKPQSSATASSPLMMGPRGGGSRGGGGGH